MSGSSSPCHNPGKRQDARMHLTGPLATAAQTASEESYTTAVVIGASCIGPSLGNINRTQGSPRFAREAPRSGRGVENAVPLLAMTLHIGALTGVGILRMAAEENSYDVDTPREGR